MMKKAWLCVVTVALSAAASAQEPGKTGEQKVVFEKKSFPFEGEVSAERLNVRMFPKSDPSGIIASSVSLGEKVTVVGEKDDFYQILPPKGCTAWVNTRNVKKEGTTGTASANDVPVRIDSRVNAEALCTLKEGETVKIVGEHLGWFKIEAPAAVKYFVGKKHVRAGKEIDPATLPVDPKGVVKETTPATTPKGDDDAAAKAQLREADTLLDAQKRLIDQQKLDDVDFAAVASAYESAAGLAKTEPVKAEADRGYHRFRDLQLIWTSLKADNARKQQHVAELKKELESRRKEEKKAFTMTGYVDTTGSTLVDRPGTHKLTMGGKMVCFLRVKDGDDKMIPRLNDLFEKYVGVNGIVIKDPQGWDGATVIMVEEIVPISPTE